MNEEFLKRHPVTHDYVAGGSQDLVIKESDDIRTVTIFGIKYAMELFRLMGTVDIGRSFRIIARKDGIVTLQVFDEDARIAELEGIVARKTSLINDLVAQALEKKEQLG